MRENKIFFLKIFIDMLLINAALISAMLLRFDGLIPRQYIAVYMNTVLLITLCHFAANWFFDMHKRLWQHSGIYELVSVVKAVTLAVILDVALGAALQMMLPRSVYILLWILSIVMMGGFRLVLRLRRSGRLIFQSGRQDGVPTLIIGAGQAGVMLAKDSLLNESSNMHIVGFIDDDPYKKNTSIIGISVLGNKEDIPRIVEEYAVEDVVIAMPSAPGEAIREANRICSKLAVRVRTLPSLYELGDGTIGINKLRSVRVEDILRREPVKVDVSSMSGYICGKTVLVTGAGGSIGSELCRQILRFSPKKLLLLGHDENPIFEIDRELQQFDRNGSLQPVIADIKDKERLRRIFSAYGPEAVFHAAAHKHVPLMEEHPSEAVKNNIFGTFNLAEAAADFNAGTFVLISTDKAANPSCVMGKTKRAAELIVRYFSQISPTKFVAVRFGNVLGSRGSVLETFREQISCGGPLTITHEEMTRYFMTIPEAVQLVIQTGGLATDGELFVLDMGEPVRIIDLARDMIRLSGLEEKDIQVEVVGIRPGEKMHEELVEAEEITEKTLNSRITKVRLGEIDLRLFREWLRAMELCTYEGNEEKEMLELLDRVKEAAQRSYKIAGGM